MDLTRVSDPEGEPTDVLHGGVRTWMLIALLLASCTADAEQARRKAADLRADNPRPRFSSGARLLEPEGGGVVVYMGLDLDPPDPRPGQALTLTHYWKVEHAPRAEAQVFVHGDVGGRRVLAGDHPPLYGRLPTSHWRPGDVWSDRHVVTIPENSPGGTLELFVGLYLDSMRWTVEAQPGAQDGQNRLRAARLPLGAPRAPDDLPAVDIPKTPTPIVADGRLDEPVWAAAPVLTFDDSLGRTGTIRHATRLRLLYDDDNLYVGFEADDVDITERYQRRDDPIYEHETVELFIMPNVAAPETGPYVELQASPSGVIFDAAFDGPRQGMNKSYNAGQSVGTTIDGTLNDPTPDRKWISEWVVPFRKIRGVSSPPKPGTEWRMNAFRIEKYNERGRLRGEFSAWSPPRVGDFHHVARFGRMRFGGASNK